MIYQYKCFIPSFSKLYLKLTPVEVMSELYDLAYNIHVVFEKHKLSYFLAFGSAVGAIRHGGIIPWDDDLDVIITEDLSLIHI